MSTVIGAAATHVGLVRAHNEDSYLADPDGAYFAVADGMGGHAAGEVASRLAVEGAAEAWSSPALRRQVADYVSRGDADARRALLSAVRAGVLAAHARILASARDNPDTQAGMGSTFTGLLVAGGDAIFAHAGDSRAYLVRDRIPVLLSEDHSVSSRLRAAGLAGRGTPDLRRWEGVLTNALGVGDARVATFLVPLYDADLLVLCSDGVHQYVAEPEIGSVLAAAPSPARAAQRLIDLALERGGEDNATAVVVKVVEAGETRVPPEQRAREEAAVAACPLLAGLGARERLRALRLATVRELDDGEPLSPVALEDRVAYVVLDGEVVVGDAAQGPGSLVHAQSLIVGAGPPRHAARARGRVRLLVLRQNDFAELADDEPELGVKLYGALAGLVAAR